MAEDKKRPMKAEALEFLPNSMELDFSPIRFPVYASPKVDGIRAVVQSEGVLSNSWKYIPNKWVQQCLRHSALWHMDGELIVGNIEDPECFAQSRGPIMSRDGQPPFTFCVFDLMLQNIPFQTRFEEILRYHEMWQNQFKNQQLGFNVIVLKQQLITNLDDLLRYEEEQLRRGYEGVMLKDPMGMYKFGRSTLKQGLLLKLKRFVDREGIITGFEELELNQNDPYIDKMGLQKRSAHKNGKVPANTLGAFILEDKAKFSLPFNVGSGLDDAARDEYWAKRDQLLGKHVKYKYQEHGSTKERPRTPIFLEIRHPDDMTTY